MLSLWAAEVVGECHTQLFVWQLQAARQMEIMYMLSYMFLSSLCLSGKWLIPSAALLSSPWLISLSQGF